MYKMNDMVVKTSDGAKIYMQLTEENNSFVKKVNFMIEKSTGELGKLFSFSLKQVMAENSPLQKVLENMGMESNDVTEVVEDVRKEIQSANAVATNNSMGIIQVHQLLTRYALNDNKSYMLYIKALGRECCIFERDNFKEILRENVYGFKNHLEILDNFQMMNILHTNPGRKDYRLSGGLPVYCFLPAENVTKDSRFDWFDEAPDAELPKKIGVVDAIDKSETSNAEDSTSESNADTEEVQVHEEPENTEAVQVHEESENAEDSTSENDTNTEEVQVHEESENTEAD